MKTLCDWSEKDIARKLDLLAELVVDARFACRKCARVANKRGALCKAERLPSPPAD